MTFNHESLVAAALSIVGNSISPITRRINMDEEGNALPKKTKIEGENFLVLPGSVGIINAVVWINNSRKATVLSSTWTLNETT